MAKIKHIALIKFKEGTTPEQIDNVFETLLDMTETIPGIEDYVAGANNSPEGLSQGYTHGFVMTLTDAAARDAYLANPELERVKAAVMPLVETVLAFDFEL